MKQRNSEFKIETPIYPGRRIKQQNMPKITKAAAAESVAGSDSVARILASEHARLLLPDSKTSSSSAASAELAAEIRRRSRGCGRRLAIAGAKLVLLYLLASVCSTLVFGQYPALWQFVQNTYVFSRAELHYNHLVRHLTVALGLHNYEILHARERAQCLVPNPLYKHPLRCCPCSKHRVVAARSGEAVRNGFDRLFDRMVNPFAYPNNSQPDLNFQQLADILKADWPAALSGSNRLRILWPPEAVAAGETVGSLKQLFLGSSKDSSSAKAPPQGRAVTWLFGHLPAIRLLRDAVRRPDHVPELTEDVFARQFVFLGDGLPAGESVHLGDMESVRGLAFAFSLHGEVSIGLALKPECCPAEVAKPDYSNQTQRLASGDVLGFMSNCYWLSVAKASTSGYAIVYIGSVYNGIHPIESKGAIRK